VFFFEPLQGIHREAQLAKDILQLDRINRATLVLAMSRRHDVTASRAVSTEKLSHYER
jgi:hypothetical protein